MKGINLKDWEVRAILDERKTQTRRVVKLNASGHVKEIGGNRRWHRDDPEAALACPYGQPGDRLWVREAWAQRLDLDHLNGTQLYEFGVRQAWYWADGPGKCCRTGCNGAAGRVRAARFMPRWASRIDLEVTGVRVERVQEISRDDAIEEGIARVDPYGFDPTLPPGMPACWKNYIGPGKWTSDPVMSFRTLWDSINGKKHPWESNPYVWVVEFRRAA